MDVTVRRRLRRRRRRGLRPGRQRGTSTTRSPTAWCGSRPTATRWARIGTKNAEINAQTSSTSTTRPGARPPSPRWSASARPSRPPAGGDGTRSLAAVALGDGFIAVGSVYDKATPIRSWWCRPTAPTFKGEDPAHSGPGLQRYNDVCVAPDRPPSWSARPAPPAPTTSAPRSARPTASGPGRGDGFGGAAASRPTPARPARTASWSSGPTTAAANRCPRLDVRGRPRVDRGRVGRARRRRRPVGQRRRRGARGEAAGWWPAPTP